MAKPLTAAESAQRILDAHRRGEEVVSILAIAGAAAGARVLKYRSGDVDGTLGSSELDAAARELADRVFDARNSELSGELFAELHSPAEQLVIFGAGHIAVPLAELGARLAFSVIVLDDREDFAAAGRFPRDVRVHTLDLADPLKDITLDAATYLVLVTRAHKHDFDLLRAVLSRDEQPRYIGMIGSRRRVRAAFTALIDGGVSREKLRHVHAPVGLDIGAETPAEIAVSIAAELIRVRRSGSAASLTVEERVLDRFFAEPSQ